MRHHVNFLLAVSLISMSFSCAGRMEEASPASIDKDTLVAVLTDLYLSDATQVTGSISDAANNAGLAAVRTGVLEKHRVPKERFMETMRYYADHPDELVIIYDKVIEELTRRQGRAPR